jgi:hypothetical protein
MSIYFFVKSCFPFLSFFFCAFVFFVDLPAVNAKDDLDLLPLQVNPDDPQSDLVLEAFLAPNEFADRRFEYVSSGDEALFSIDAVLSASEPYAELHPERMRWPKIADIDLVVVSQLLRLEPVGTFVDDDLLDKGFFVRWKLAPLGQRFDPSPHFVAKIVEADVVSRFNGKSLFYWHSPPLAPICRENVSPGKANCELKGVGLEASGLSLSPDGTLLALAHGGLRPRLEIYSLKDTLRILWQSFFNTDSGGPVEVAFSSDGKWVVVLTGRGRMHRFLAKTGEQHLCVGSAGRTARSLPPGRIMAVAGEKGEVKLWYLSDGTIAWRLPPRRLRGPIDRIAASGNGKRFATLEYDEDLTVVRVWEVRKRSILSEINVDSYDISDIALDEKGETLYVAHEKKGLLATPVERHGSLRPVGDRRARRCRGRLQWLPGRGLLNCTVPRGCLRLDSQGKVESELVAGGDASNWIVTGATEGHRLAAVGGGRLLVWWTD